MTPALEERAAAFSKEFMRCLHSGFGQDHLTNMTIQHLRAVEQAATKAAYERIEEKASIKIGAPYPNNWPGSYEDGWKDCQNSILKHIRALADGGSDGTA